LRMCEQIMDLSVMTSEEQTGQPDGDALESELKRLLRRIADEPVSSDLRLLAQQLADALDERERARDPASE
jgi:hypothetical protein